MTEALEGEVLPAGTTPTPTDQLDPEALELGSVNRVGRPTDMTPEVVTKLLAAFNNLYNITEACAYADISRTTYYRWLEADDKFSYKMSQAQSAPTRKAKEVVMDGVKAGDTSLALRLLMLRDPDFKPKVEGGANPEVNETRENLRKAIDAISKHDPSIEPTATNGADNRGVVADSPTDIS